MKVDVVSYNKCCGKVKGFSQQLQPFATILPPVPAIHVIVLTMGSCD